MTQKLLTINGGRLGKEANALQTNEEAEVPILPPGFERTYAPDAETEPEEVVLPPRPVKDEPPFVRKDPTAEQLRLDKEIEEVEIDIKKQEGPA